MMYLLDANIVSDFIAPQPHAAVRARMDQHRGQCALAAPVFHELVYGCSKLPRSKRRSRIEEFLAQVEASLPILPYDTAAARWHGQERARLYKQTPPFSDGLIAAVAAVHGLIMVTRNVEHFRPFSVKIENWFD